MFISLEIEGPEAVAKTAELRAWLQEARLRQVERVTQDVLPTKPGEQGPTLLAALTVVLASPAVVALVQSIHRYIEAKIPKTKITVTEGKKKIEIDCTNPPPLADLIAQAKILMEQ